MIVEILILALAIPVGFLIAYLARDELIAGRKWFLALALLSVLFGIFSYLFLGNLEVALSCYFVSIVSLVSMTAGRNKRWTKKRI